MKITVAQLQEEGTPEINYQNENAEIYIGNPWLLFRGTYAPSKNGYRFKIECTENEEGETFEYLKGEIEDYLTELYDNDSSVQEKIYQEMKHNSEPDYDLNYKEREL